tara:strand:+ start:420 stop:797 length:378 start_codon:yes stop_codon:yes gene_type:complete
MGKTLKIKKMPDFDKTTGFTMRGSEFYGHGNQSPNKQKTQEGELKPPTPAFNRAADPLAKGTETTRTSKNLVTGGTNTVAKYGSPAKVIAGALGTAATIGAMSKIGKKMSEDKDDSPTDYGKHAK